MKAFFLGPKSENEAWVRSEIQSILDHWFGWRKSLFPNDPEVISKPERREPAFLADREAMSQALAELNDLLEDETPKFTPRYIGHMVSEISLPAIFGHFAALLHNPNNTSKEVARVGTVIEREALEMLAEMIGFEPSEVAGHFTGGGTMANFEAIWRARYRLDHWLSLALYLAEHEGVPLRLADATQMGWQRYRELVSEYSVPDEKLRDLSAVVSNPYETAELISKHIGRPYRGPVILVPGNKHFSWQKGTNIFGLGEEAFWTVDTEAKGKLSIASLKQQIDRAENEQRPVLMVVSVAGTTEAGEIDPVHDVVDLLEGLKRTRGRNIWHHVDAAYGGFMCSLLHTPETPHLSSENRKALAAIRHANSVTLDPHKLGYIPYACGAFLARDEEAYAVSSFKAAYLDRPDLGDGKWSTTIEGSRSAAGASATWLTGKTMGFASPKFAEVISSTFEACHAFREALESSCPWVQVLHPVDTNILCFSIAKPGDTLSHSNAMTDEIFDRLVESPNFAVSRTVLGAQFMAPQITKHMDAFGGVVDADHLVLLRCVFMNPFLASPEVRTRIISEFSKELESHYQAAVSSLTQ